MSVEAAPIESRPPSFSPDKVTVIFVLGGPGAGKGTQCASLVKHYGFTHLSAGDLLRAEQEREGSKAGELIKEYIREGLIVPHEVTIGLLRIAMAKAMGVYKEEDEKKNENVPSDAPVEGRFLIDGFPRKMDQALAFEDMVCPARLVLFFDCPEAEMQRRLLVRGETSGRTDDNLESIKKRFKTFLDTSMPVVRHFEELGKLVKIDATPAPDDVYKATVAALGDKLGRDF